MADDEIGMGDALELLGHDPTATFTTGSTTVTPNAADAEMNRLRAENQRLTERLVVVYEEGDRQAMRILTLRRDQDRLSAVIDQVRAHCENAKTRAAQLLVDTGESFYTDDVDPDDILALLPDTHTAQEDPK